MRLSLELVGLIDCSVDQHIFCRANVVVTVLSSAEAVGAHLDETLNHCTKAIPLEHLSILHDQICVSFDHIFSIPWWVLAKLNLVSL